MAGSSTDTRLEAVVIPVSDVDRSKRFYEGLGWRLDADFAFENGFRVVQLTPPGSECSVQFGTRISDAAPGSAQGLYLVVKDVDAVREQLTDAGAIVSAVFHPVVPGAQFQPDGAPGRAPGPAPDETSYRTFASFADPDGNRWLLQQVTTRLPGRGVSLEHTSLTELLREAEAQHGEHGAQAPQHHWSAWYAAYVLSRLRGSAVEVAATEATTRIASSQGY
jgi:catechol 2,3-dioxygenase-like lactoylglutathione lyase family enzyme